MKSMQYCSLSIPPLSISAIYRKFRKETHFVTGSKRLLDLKSIQNVKWLCLEVADKIVTNTYFLG